MSDRPNNIQKIDAMNQGKMLNKNNFPDFADTWNYITDFIDNLKGDADVQQGDITSRTAHITVDKTKSDHPIIRFQGTIYPLVDDKSVGFTQQEQDIETSEECGSCAKAIADVLEVKGFTNKESIDAPEETVMM